MAKKVTIHDIAKELKIASSTVSRALNNNPRISERTAQLIQQTAIRMGYEPNHLASALRKGRSKTIGVIVPYFDRAFFGSIVGGIEEILEAKGYSLVLCQSHDDSSSEAKAVDILMRAQAEGIFVSVAPNSAGIAHLERVHRSKIPLIMFDRIEESIASCSIEVNDFKGAYIAVQHLVEQGAKNIVHFSGNHNLKIYRERYNGYKQALLDNGLVFAESNVLYGNCFVSEGERMAEKLIHTKQVPDAIFCSSDHKAIGAMKSFVKAGIAIPDRIKIVGFSNEPFSEHTQPSLTTVDQQTKKMGRLAAESFLLLKKSEKSQILDRQILEPELVVRKSSGDNSLKVNRKETLLASGIK